MASRSLLLRRQRSWARRAGLRVDAAGYLPDVAANLRGPLSPSALADFTARGGSEFHDGEGRAGRAHAARLRAVHSSTALAVNVFDYWNGSDAAPLGAALGLPAPVRRIVFEPHLPTGLGGNPANPDVLLGLENGALVALECKFSEWLVPRRARGQVFHERYFPPDRHPWEEAGLPECQALAAELQAGTEYFRYLDTGQLLKHALGLAATGATDWTLVYLYFDWPGSIQRAHAAELARVAARLSGETGFRALSYQALVADWPVSSAPVGREFLAYLSARYGLWTIEA